MSFSYTSPDTNDVHAIRFMLGDTTDTGHLLEDEEITFLLNRWKPAYDSLEYIAAVAAETIAARFAREANYSADGVSISLAQLGQQFRELAASLREQYRGLLVGGTPDVGGISPYEQSDPSVKPLDFGTGMHDNAEAGRQSYGQRDYVNGYYDPHNNPGV